MVMESVAGVAMLVVDQSEEIDGVPMPTKANWLQQMVGIGATVDLPASHRKTVLMIDDHRFITTFATQLLCDAFEVVCAHTSTETRVALARQSFDAVILDLNLNEVASGIDLLGELWQHTRNVVIFYDVFDAAAFRTCLRYGVPAMVGKHDDPARLRFAIETVLAGHQVYPPTLLQTLFAAPENQLPRLTRRECQVLDVVVTDPARPNADLAHQFNLSEGRIKNILTDLFRHFSVATRHQLASEARRRGFVPGQTYQPDLIAPVSAAGVAQ